MSKEFRDYLMKLHREDLNKKTSMLGSRHDAFSKELSAQLLRLNIDH
jgi:hypothetical protein